jgi:hypothetical protein
MAVRLCQRICQFASIRLLVYFVTSLLNGIIPFCPFFHYYGSAQRPMYEYDTRNGLYREMQAGRKCSCIPCKENLKSTHEVTPRTKNIQLFRFIFSHGVL